VPDPFLRSYLLTRVGVGFTERVSLPVIEVGDDTVLTLRGELMTALIDFVYQQQVKNWLSFRASFSIAGRLGTDAESIIAAGVDAGSDVQLGWLVRAFERRATKLSVFVGVSRGSVNVIQPAKFLDDILDGRSAKLSDSIPSVQAIGSARFAHGFSRLLGVKVLASLLYGEQTFSRDSGLTFNWKAGASASLDPRKALGIPVGFLLSYSFSTLSPGSRESGVSTQEIELKIDYTAPADYQFGVSFAVTRGPSELQKTVNLTSVQISSRFYL
jgi:hypothetical protein